MYQIQTVYADGRTATIHSQWPSTIEDILEGKIVEAVHEGKAFSYQPTCEPTVVFDDGTTITVEYIHKERP